MPDAVPTTEAICDLHDEPAQWTRAVGVPDCAEPTQHRSACVIPTSAQPFPKANAPRWSSASQLLSARAWLWRVASNNSKKLKIKFSLAFENQQGHIFVALLNLRTARGDLPPKTAVQPAAFPVWQVPAWQAPLGNSAVGAAGSAVRPSAVALAAARLLVAECRMSKFHQ